jgi:DNA-directed RNA polymerase alpha subunit
MRFSSVIIAAVSGIFQSHLHLFPFLRLYQANLNKHAAYIPSKQVSKMLKFHKEILKEFEQVGKHAKMRAHSQTKRILLLLNLSVISYGLLRARSEDEVQTLIKNAQDFLKKAEEFTKRRL